MAYPNARFLSLAALALCPTAAGFQTTYTDPDENVEEQSSETFLQGSADAQIHRLAAGSFMMDGIAHAGGLALVSPDPASSDRFVYHMDQLDHWRAFYKVVDEAAIDMGVLRGQGPGGRDVALVLQAGGLKAFVTNADQDGFELSANHTLWAGITKIWVCEDSSGNDVVFGLPAQLGAMYRAIYDHATGTFTDGGSFACPFEVEDLVALDYDTANAGQELAMLASSGTLTIHPWSGLSTLATHVPYAAVPDAGAISVMKGDGAEQDLLMWRYRANSPKVYVRAFNADNSSRPFSLPVLSWTLGGIANGDWDNDGQKDMMVAMRGSATGAKPRIMVAERIPDGSHSWGTIRFQRSTSPSDAIAVDHTGSGPGLYNFTTPAQILVIDQDLDGDIDLQLAGARAGGIQVIQNSAVKSMRPTMEVPPLSTFVGQLANGAEVVTTTVDTLLPAGWPTHALQPTHLRLEFWNRQYGTDPWDLQDGHSIDVPLPASPVGDGAETLSHTLQFPEDWITTNNFAFLIHGSLVHLDANGDYTGELAIGKTVYSWDGGNRDYVLKQKKEHIEALLGGDGTGGGDDSSSGGGRESSSTPPGGGSNGSGTGNGG